MDRILVVDDNAASRELLHALLKRPDREIIEASNGRDALELAAGRKPDLLLLDVEMPVQDGYAVLRILRAIPEFARTPVFAVTANAMQGAREAALAAGFDRYITKPIDGVALRRQVAELLASRKEQQ